MPSDDSGLAVVRQLEDRDVEPVIELWRVCGLLRPWNDPHYDISFCRRSEHAGLLVLELEQTLVGAIMVGHDGHRGWFYYLAVHPDHQSSGHGARLLQAGERWLGDRGVPKINVMVRTDNHAVQEFYDRSGYSRDEVTVLAKRLIDPRDS